MREITGTHSHRSGLYTPGSVRLQPALILRGLVSDGLRLDEEAAVVALRRNGSWVAEMSCGPISAPRVILAVNGHAGAFGQFAGHLMHVFAYASMIRTLPVEEQRIPGGAPGWGVTPAAPMGTMVRRVTGPGSARIVVRNRFTWNPSLTSSDEQLARIARDHDSAFAARVPMLQGVEMQHR